MLPRWAQAGLALLFVATAASTLISQTGVGSDRASALDAVWISAVGTALHYGAQQERPPGAGRRSYRIALAVVVVVGAGLAGATFLLGRDPIDDDKATHAGLAAQFGDASWYQHVVAANTDHAAFVVYLDTRDAAIQAETCTALTAAAAGRGRVPDLYYATGGHGHFARSC